MAPPYRIGKGPIVIALEGFVVERGRAAVEQWYEQLAAGSDHLETLQPTAFDSFLENSDPEAYDHLMQDVFGARADALGLPQAQADEIKERGLSRRRVYGQGMRRALEIAYGFGGQPVDPPWTIDAYWGCGQSYNLVGLRTNPDKQIVTVIIYSDEQVTEHDDEAVRRSDPANRLVPNEGGEFFIVDDREGVGVVNEWRATRAIGLASSPPPN